jgi:hypothetical protein
MKNKLFVTALFLSVVAVAAALAGCATQNSMTETVPDEDESNWIDIQSADEIAGVWQGYADMPMDAQAEEEAGYPASSVGITVILGYIKGSDKYTLDIKVNIEKILTDWVNTPKMKKNGFTKDMLWTIIANNAGDTDEYTVGEKYFLNTELSDSIVSFVSGNFGDSKQRVSINKNMNKLKIVSLDILSGIEYKNLDRIILQKTSGVPRAPASQSSALQRDASRDDTPQRAAVMPLTEARLWALSLAGIMTEMHQTSRGTLNANEMNKKNNASWLETLRRDWSVTTREEFLQNLEQVENTGNAGGLRYIKAVVNEVMREKQDFSVKTMSKYQLEAYQYNRLKFIVANWNQYKDRTIMAWDLGRCISLCRWGYQAGFITEAEAWEKIMYYAQKLQLFYNSWEEYGYDYFMGRVFWASGFGEETDYFRKTEPVYRRLTGEYGYWNSLKWYTRLTGPEQDRNDSSPATVYFKKPVDNDGTLQFWTTDPKYYNVAPSHFFDNPGQDKNTYQCVVKKMSGNEDYAFGLLFCVDTAKPASYYRLFITVKGRYTVQKNLGNDWAAAPVDWADSAFLRKGYKTGNRLKVVRADHANGAATFSVYFNDQLAVTFQDPEPLTGVKMGAAASVNTASQELFPAIPVDVRFEY